MSEDGKDGKSEKPLFVTRCIAFLIDAFIVLLLSSLFATPFVNSDKLLSISEDTRVLLEKYNNNEVTEQEYLVELSNIEYMMARSTELVSIFSILFGVIYYVVMPLYMKGQTLGKKLFKLKIESTVGELSSNQLLFRAFIADFLLLNIISVLFIMFASRSVYLQCSELFTFVQYTITFASIIMMIISKEGITIHDRLVNTKVIKIN